MEQIKLTPRLQSVADFATQNCILADVGTDHAYLPSYLLLKGVTSFAIASDIRSGPLQRAKSTAEKYQLSGKMDFRLCPGLDGIKPDEVDTVCICGMGGETITDILSAASWLQNKKYHLILQPMNSIPDLRKYLIENGFKIRRESIAEEGFKLYVILDVVFEKEIPYTTAEIWVGRNNREEPLFTKYLNKVIDTNRKILNGMSKADNCDNKKETYLQMVNSELDKLISGGV